MSISMTWLLGREGALLPPPQPSAIAASDKAVRHAARPVRDVVMGRTLAEKRRHFPSIARDRRRLVGWRTMVALNDQGARAKNATDEPIINRATPTPVQ